MINRNININDLSTFDFFNDASDTIRWLRRIGRKADADIVESERRKWWECWDQNRKYKHETQS